MRAPFKSFFLPTIFVLLLLPAFVLRAKADCEDVAQRGTLSVLTINILFHEVKDRTQRLRTIADFVKEKSQWGDPVDVILLQEVVGGVVATTKNSALDLKNLLKSRGLDYNLAYRLANGVPGALSVGNAVLSRCKINLTLSQMLPIVAEEPFTDVAVPLRRGVIMVRLDAPGYGRINVYNTHLCAFCTPESRLEQAEVLARFLELVEGILPGDNPVVLGGDFNTDLNVPAQLPVYDLFTVDQGFIDSYAEVNGCTDCCSIAEGFLGCTYGVPGNPYLDNPFSSDNEPKRIDYILAKGVGEVLSSEVVFNEDPYWASDHSGVLTTFTLP